MAESLPGTRVIVNGARKCDVDGEADGFWVVFHGDQITATRSVLSLVANPVVALER